jgi:uncharacterized protein
MSIYAVTYRYVDNPDALTEVRPAHREYLGSLVGAKPGLIVSGRTEGGEGASALLILDANSPDEVAQLLDLDPFWLEGLITSREILEWTIASGSLGSGH